MKFRDGAEGEAERESRGEKMRWEVVCIRRISERLRWMQVVSGGTKAWVGQDGQKRNLDSGILFLADRLTRMLKVQSNVT